jgi:hypothetical protein
MRVEIWSPFERKYKYISVPDLPPPQRKITIKETGQSVPQVWCSMHDRHPDECFDWHHPLILAMKELGISK